jgi:alkylation response protein AidB-like acyl-CoA dehydrogenase
MADLGWLGLAIPSEFGGADGSLIDQEVLFEEIGRALVPGPLFASSVLATQILLRASSQDQKVDLLPGMARGETVVTTAPGEPSIGPGYGGLDLKAVADSSGYLLEGARLFMPYAHEADYILCTAETSRDGGTTPTPEPGEGATLFLIDTATAGVKTQLLESVAGYKQHQVMYDQVRVQHGAVLGRMGYGLDYLAGAVEWATVVQCGEIIGRSEKVLELVVEYSKNRIQFGRPIGSFQAVQHQCADLKVALDGARLVTRQAAWKLTEGLPCSDDVSMAKACAGSLSRLATATGHGIFAGIAFTVEHDMQLYTMRSKIAESNLGDTDYHLAKLGAQMGL